MAGILQEVAATHDVTVEDLKSEARGRWIVYPRQEAMWRMVQTGKFSLPQIASFLNRDHTTVLHGWKQHGKRLRREDIQGCSQEVRTPRGLARSSSLQITA
jgi:chromosomal replication initiation ATPase DnaA